MFNKVAVKGIIVLIVIAVASGLALSVLSDVFYVSDDDKVRYRLAQVYGESMLTEECEIDTSFESDKGAVNGVYLMDDGAVVVRSTGYEGYRSGWIRCFIAYTQEGVLVKLVIEAYNNQTMMSSFDSKWLNANFSNKDTTDITVFTASGGGAGTVSIAGGASYSTNAVINSANVSLQYLRHIGYFTADETAE